LAINPYFPCPVNDYNPVCGCDQKTYRNECDAKFKNGVNSYNQGTCSGFEIDIIPTFDPFTLTFTLAQSNPLFTHLFVIDFYGRLWWNKEITPQPSSRANLYLTQIQVDISALPVSSYLLYVYDSKGTYRYKKFTKMPQ
jgi:hypothetical protein